MLSWYKIVTLFMMSNRTLTFLLMFLAVASNLFCMFVKAENENDYTLKEVDIISKKGQPVRIFSSTEVKEYDGSDGSKPIFMGIKGVVFDVSKGKDFYGKSGPYNVLVGKDSTRAVAKMSLDPKDLNENISDLPGPTLKFLDEIFEGTYMAKYPVAGYMDYLLDQMPDKFQGLDMDKSEL